jgi:transcriptional regulator with PAS, ATPase and Fis domain
MIDLNEFYKNPQNITPEVIAGFRKVGLVEEAKALVDFLENKTPQDRVLNTFITEDSDMIELKATTRKLSEVEYPVLIIGETGTGKEILAKALHGAKDENRFIPINCAGLPEHLIESELFGHTAGAFTGASREKMGMMEVAKNGTIFLDEIGDLPFSAQSKLLRAIQEKKIRRVGSNTELPINCRIVAATHVDLEKNHSNFREDLFYRLSTFILRTKPLKDRMGDVPLIIKVLDPEDKCKNMRPINPEELKGNVRSLQQLVIRYQILGKI